MEKEDYKRTNGQKRNINQYFPPSKKCKIEDEIINDFIIKARNGDKESMLLVINYFQDEIEYLTKYIKMPKEDAIQSIKLELISFIKEK